MKIFRAPFQPQPTQIFCPEKTYKEEMGKTAQLVMGPAGAGKSTYCSTIISHCISLKRSVHLVNMDPAAEYSMSNENSAEERYLQPTVNIQDLIDLDSVMEELGFGPNGGLIYALEYLIDNIEWLEEKLGDFDDDNLIIDCPGQIELYTHCTIMKSLVDCLERRGYTVCGVYLLDSQFMQDSAKFFAGIMSAMSAMLQLGIPHINIMTKMDLVTDQPIYQVDRFLSADSSLLLEDINQSTSPKFHALNNSLVKLIDEFSMVNLIPLNIKDEESIAHVLSHIDHATQYGEDLEPKEVNEREVDETFE